MMTASRSQRADFALRPMKHEFGLTRSVAGRLQQLSSRVARLIPDRRDPERFFEERSEVAYELRDIAVKVMQLDSKHGQID
jgi:hypothetical protein